MERKNEEEIGDKNKIYFEILESSSLKTVIYFFYNSNTIIQNNTQIFFIIQNNTQGLN